jgi:hypothetical protein
VFQYGVRVLDTVRFHMVLHFKGISMHMNVLTVCFRCTECNGYPYARIMLDGQLLHDHAFTQAEEIISINIDTLPADHILTVERYNKQYHNVVLQQDQIIQDQILEITNLLVDDVAIPINLVDTHCSFAWDGHVHPKSRYFGPNGTWTYKFSTPIITHILDLRIEHESQYNQDYIYPWSNRLGPMSVQEILDTIKQVEQRIHQVL